MKRFIRDHFPEFGLAFGLIVATLLTIIICAWEWLENPGGIFRNDEGTQWPFIWETAWSWWGPTFLYTVVLASIAHLVWFCLHWLISKLRNKT